MFIRVSLFSATLFAYRVSRGATRRFDTRFASRISGTRFAGFSAVSRKGLSSDAGRNCPIAHDVSAGNAG